MWSDGSSELKDVNLSELIGQKLLDNPYYDSRDNKKVKLTGICSIDGKYKKIFNSNQIRPSLLSGRYFRSLAKYHENFIFAKTVEHAQTLRLKFEMEFDFVIYVLINANKEEHFEYLDKVILNCELERFKIVFEGI